MLVRGKLPLFATPKHFFSLVMMMFFFVIMMDAMVAYLVPVIIEEHLHSTFLMGLVLSTSSMVGVAVDFLFSKVFPLQRSIFFWRIFFVTFVTIPPFLLLGGSVASYILAMAIWGIYYEALTFGKYNAIHEVLKREEYAWGWGMEQVVHNLALVLGPVLASVLLQTSTTVMMMGMYIVYLVGLALFVVMKSQLKVKAQLPSDEHPLKDKHTFLEQLKIWRVYERVLWPLLGMSMLLFLIDAAFFTIGPLITETLRQQHPLGILFMSAYSVTGLGVGFLVQRLAKPYGKKRLVFIAGIVSGISLLFFGIVGMNLWLLLLVTLTTSIGINIMIPALSAVFEDYIDRSSKHENDLIGLTALCTSISYVIGPIVNGYLAEKISPTVVFSFWGALLIVYSVTMLVVVPRKIRLPQVELADVTH